MNFGHLNYEFITLTALFQKLVNKIPTLINLLHGHMNKILMVINRFEMLNEFSTLIALLRRLVN